MNLFTSETHSHRQVTAELLYATGEEVWQHLLKRNGSNSTRADNNRQKLDNYIQLLLVELSGHELVKDDVVIVAFLWYQYFARGDKKTSMGEMLSHCPLPKAGRFGICDHLNSLMGKGLVMANRMLDSRRIEPLEKLDFSRMDGLTFRVHPGWIKHIMTGDPFVVHAPVRSAVTSEAYLSLWFGYIELLERINSSYDDDEKSALILEASSQLDELLQLEQTEPVTSFALAQLFREHGLDGNERTIIAALLRSHIENTQTNMDSLMRLICRDVYARIRNTSYFSREGKLIRLGIIHTGNERGFKGHSTHITIDNGIAMRILSSREMTGHERLVDLIAGSSLVTVRTPEKGLSDIVISDELKNDLRSAIGRFDTDIMTTLTDWGVCKNGKPKLVILFYGDPGTGKTLAAEVLAKELNKDLLITDVSRILSSWVGESQQNVSKLFQTFAKMNQTLDNPPVLLLNECDQLLMKRTGSSDSSVSTMFNQMQNLILEALERIQGVVILTTNLANALDPAFSRRFDLKIRFKEPLCSERKSIWDLHLLPTIPGVDELDTDSLAREYEVTGGQIALIVSNAVTEAASKPECDRRLTMGLVRRYADLESFSLREVPKKVRMGF